MTVQRALYSRSQQEKAMRLVARAAEWGEGVRKEDGLRFNVFASESAPGVYYTTHFAGRDCSCPGAQKSRNGRCYHQLATAIASEQAQEQAAKPTKRYEDIWPDDDLTVAAF